MKIIAHSQSNLHKAAFQGEALETWIHGNRGVGKAIVNPAETTIVEVVHFLEHCNDRYRFSAFDNTYLKW